MEFKKIGEILELQRGYDLPVEAMVKGEVPVVGSNGIVGYHNISRSICPTITMGRSGTIGKVHFYNRETWVHNTALFVSDFKGNNPLYIYYLLDNLNFDNLKSSSVVPSLNRNYVYPMKVPFYNNILDQEKISNVLWVIDQKISLNTRMNAELEAMAKQLYDYWFVQFDFPDENGKPYKSSGGKMVYNEKLKREIPEGWEVSTYGKEFDVKLGGTPSTSEGSFWNNGTIHWLNSGEVQNFPINTSEKKITEEAIRGSSTEYLPKGSVLISITRYLRVTILNIDACINQSVAGFAETDNYKYPYTYFSLSAEVPRLMTLRTGAQQPHINKEIIEASPIVLPSKRVLNDYYSKSAPLFKSLINHSEEIMHLTHLRDSLLPMLMNGQVTIE
ncbi:MAG: restriction endonuclease subunit S [Prevotella sp.]|nr:restriction endonuclease subunit S [Prevotella sp.]